MSPWLVLGAAALEGCVGYRAGWGHPVALPAWLIMRLEAAWNQPRFPRRAMGVATVLVLVTLAILTGLGLQQAPWPAVILSGAFGLAGRSLYDHVRAVAAPLAGGDLAGAREQVARIVGRDTEHLDEAGVATAALESLAESFSDGLIAPLFWFLIGGLPGLVAYKAVNTADSMIGHRETRYRLFGWAAARTDDMMNLIPARISGLLISLAAGRGFRTMWRDAMKHASPNSGWPEAAMAGALDITLGGPVAYDGVVARRATLGRGPLPTPADLSRGLAIYLRACGLAALALISGGLAWSCL